jgi:hypothetical protein
LVFTTWWHLILVWRLFSNNLKGVKMLFLEWSSMLESWNISWNWIMDLCFHPLCCLIVIGWKMELIIETTPHTNKTISVFYLQILDIYYMKLMNLLYSLHKSSRYFKRMIQRRHFGKLYSIDYLKVEELWQTHLMIALMHAIMSGLEPLL